MSDILSQNEIDDLLSALNTGELTAEEVKNDNSEQKVKEYDFTRPAKFAKEHLRTLEVIFEHFSRLVSSTMPAYVRTSVNAAVVSSETVSFMEFSNSLSEPVLLSIFELYPLKGNLMFEMSTKLGFEIVNRQLGGRHFSGENDRPFSDIELSILDNIVRLLLSMMIDPFENVLEVEPELLRLETNPQFAQVISPTEIVALITLTLSVGDTEGLINIVLPHNTLEPILENLNTKSWFAMAREQDDEIYKDIIEKRLATSLVPVKAILGTGTISVNDFIGLRVGDIIKLNSKITDDIIVQVGNLDKFKSKPGLLDGKNSVRVTSVIGKEE